jgi:hypothetical protein
VVQASLSAAFTGNAKLTRREFVDNEGGFRLHGIAKLKLRPAMWWSICTPYPPGVLPQGLRVRVILSRRQDESSRRRRSSL